MSKTWIPVVEHHRPNPPSAAVARVEQIAASMLDGGEFSDDAALADLQARAIDPVPTLHLDDHSDLRVLRAGPNIAYRQDMARLRAAEGDLVAACLEPVEGFEAYCRDRLGIGSVTWLTPDAPKNPLQVAAALWQNPQTRQALVDVTRHHGRLQIDPYKGTKAVWQLARLLRDETALPVSVVAPLPRVAQWANHKRHFADTALQLFGPEHVPCTLHAANFAKAAEMVRRLAPASSKIVLKLPDSVGGGGNLTVPSDRFRGLGLSQIRGELKAMFFGLLWKGESELLVGVWESDALSAPSAQLWVPPDPMPPIVEGLFEQTCADDHGMFVGSRRAELAPPCEQEIVDRCWLLARLFQRLGYVGRCSFDLLLVPKPSGSPQLEFLECNGRWGGVSVPMTLMNRLFGDFARQPFACRDYMDLGLEKTSLNHVLDSLGDTLYDIRSGRGSLILTNPARMQARGGIGVIALGDTWSQAADALGEQVPARLMEAVSSQQGAVSYQRSAKKRSAKKRSAISRQPSANKKLKADR
jgi:hypothetical protein